MPCSYSVLAVVVTFQPATLKFVTDTKSATTPSTSTTSPGPAVSRSSERSSTRMARNAPSARNVKPFTSTRSPTAGSPVVKSSMFAVE